MHNQESITFLPMDRADVSINSINPCISTRNEYLNSLDKCGNYNAHWKFQESDEIENAILLGMSPTNYHNFLVCQDTEWHPRFTINLPKIGRARRRSVRAGAILKITGLNSAELNQFSQYLKSLSHVRSPNCHIGALQALKAGANITIPKLGHWKLTPEQFLTEILENGLLKDNKKINVELIVTKDISVNQMMSEVRFFQNKFKWFYLLNDFLYFFIKKLKPTQVISE
tara:strand:- start:40040 stop:40723 length:684 start_codon:yes stop_codon:yes gene_type:complete